MFKVASVLAFGLASASRLDYYDGESEMVNDYGYNYNEYNDDYAVDDTDYGYDYEDEYNYGDDEYDYSYDTDDVSSDTNDEDSDDLEDITKDLANVENLNDALDKDLTSKTSDGDGSHTNLLDTHDPQNVERPLHSVSNVAGTVANAARGSGSLLNGVTSHGFQRLKRTLNRIYFGKVSKQVKCNFCKAVVDRLDNGYSCYLLGLESGKVTTPTCDTAAPYCEAVIDVTCVKAVAAIKQAAKTDGNSICKKVEIDGQTLC